MPCRKEGKFAGTSSWPSWISHFTGSFVGHSPSEMLCPPAVKQMQKHPYDSKGDTHTHTYTHMVMIATQLSCSRCSPPNTNPRTFVLPARGRWSSPPDLRRKKCRFPDASPEVLQKAAARRPRLGEDGERSTSMWHVGLGVSVPQSSQSCSKKLPCPFVKNTPTSEMKAKVKNQPTRKKPQQAKQGPVKGRKGRATSSRLAWRSVASVRVEGIKKCLKSKALQVRVVCTCGLHRLAPNR